MTATAVILALMPTPDDLSPLKAKPFSDAVDKLEELMTQSGGVVLVQNYQDIGLELELVMDVQEKLLQKVWHERTPQCKTDQDLPNEV
jgi:hypothetical protein